MKVYLVRTDDDIRLVFADGLTCVPNHIIELAELTCNVPRLRYKIVPVDGTVFDQVLLEKIFSGECRLKTKDDEKLTIRDVAAMLATEEDLIWLADILELDASTLNRGMLRYSFADWMLDARRLDRRRRDGQVQNTHQEEQSGQVHKESPCSRNDSASLREESVGSQAGQVFTSDSPTSELRSQFYISPLKALARQVQTDTEYAWAWHCQIAVAAQDEGVDHRTANYIAMRAMQTIFQIDTSTLEAFKSTVRGR